MSLLCTYISSFTNISLIKQAQFYINIRPFDHLGYIFLQLLIATRVKTAAIDHMVREIHLVRLVDNS